MSDTDSDDEPVAASIDPFDLLAAHAIAEHKAGRTRTLESFTEEHGIDLGSADGRVGDTHATS